MGKVVRMDNAKVMIQMDQHIPNIAILHKFHILQVSIYGFKKNSCY
jgi:hypothetical protein